MIFVVVKVIVGARNKNSNKNSGLTQGESKSSVSVGINKNFEFLAIDASKTKVPVVFTLVSAERKEDITLKGESRKPSSGKDYLFLRVEIQNNKTERVAIASMDRIRLKDDKGNLYAPDYHNGNVVVDPISTKKDLLAFAVDKKQKTFILQVGELDGEKQEIEVKF